MTTVVFKVTDDEGQVYRVKTKSQAEAIIADKGGSYENEFIERPSDMEAYCKPITRNPANRT